VIRGRGNSSDRRAQVERRVGELTEWGEAAVQQLRGPALLGFRRKLALWRDPRARMLRRRRRAKHLTVTGAVSTGALGGGSVLAFSPPYLVPGIVEGGGAETMLDVAGFGIGGLAVALGVGTISAGLRYRRLLRTPLPDPPPEPVELPLSGSQAREPMRRLRDAEQSLHGALTQLTAAGVGVAGDSVADARETAGRAAGALRQVADRLVVVEAALPHAPESDRAALREEVGRMRRELDEGVEGYGRLVAAAGRAVAASGAGEQASMMQDATDRLAGLASALQELSGPAFDPRAAGDGSTTQEPPREGRGQPR
jgi:hypothetical protein